MAIKHNKVATVPDDGVSEVGTDEWNDDHDIEDNTITNDHLVGLIANSKLATDPLDRTNHTGTQTVSTISDYATATATFTNKTIDVDGTGNSITNIANANIKAGASIDLAKLATDPLARANHTGTQAISSVSGLQSALDGKVDDSQVLTNVPSGAVFTDTTYSVGDNGLTEKNFTSTLKTKLDGVATNANNYSHPSHTGDVTGSSSLTIASGAVDLSHMSASGTKNSTTYLRGDNTWASISAGGDVVEEFSGTSSGNVSNFNITSITSNKKWYHVIALVKGNGMGSAPYITVNGTGSGYYTQTRELRGYSTQHNNSNGWKFARNSMGQGCFLEFTISGGAVRGFASPIGSTGYATHFGGWNSSSTNISSIRIYNNGSAQSGWEVKVYSHA